jgi:acyl-CoA synthetase (AMP-forming)/AMP-acid ligase II
MRSSARMRSPSASRGATPASRGSTGTAIRSPLRLIAAGIAPGDRIAYVGKNSDYFFEILFGAAKCGAVLTSIGWRLSPAEIANMLDDSKARFVFVGPEIQDQVMQAIARLESPRHIHRP